MFKDRTLVVLGAASSLDFEFPLGEELKKEIKNLLRRKTYYNKEYGQTVILKELADKAFSALLSRYTGTQQYVDLSDDILKAVDIVRNGIGFASSIDNFLVLRSEANIVKCAKAAIAWNILRAESKARTRLGFSQNKSPLDVDVSNTWFQQFAEICFSDATARDLPDALSRVRVVSFNYDRCFEFFLQKAIMGLYSLPANDAGREATKLLVLHPYGSLGSAFGAESLVFGYSDDLSRVDSEIVRIFDRIRTFGEGTEVQKQIGAFAEWAERIVFLGYGFHKQNNELFSVDPAKRTTLDVFGTAVKISKPAREAMAFSLQRILACNLDDITLEDLGCKDFLNEYRHALIN